ncbi:MAG TPA: pseudouridine synthase [Tissierellaceae bacterium]|nr:pseudouridine synthase [Tissierellaceae bacterium]
MKKMERIDKIISNMGYGSRKNVKKTIRDGRVMVNDSIVTDNTIKIDPYKNKIYVDGQEILYREYIYIMMNKPQNVVSSTYDPNNTIVLELIDIDYLIYEPFPMGRLDKDTEGLLLISNDGKLAHKILSPKNKVNKKYYVEVNGYIEDKHIERFKEGVILDDGYQTLPGKLEIIESNIISRVYLTIQEGKFHQVKRMFKSVCAEVMYLKRISIGKLSLDSTLEPGEYRELTDSEINLLKKS